MLLSFTFNNKIKSSKIANKNIDLNSIKDTYFSTYYPDNNYNNNGKLNAYYSDSEIYQDILLFFDLSSLANHTVNSAILKLYRRSDLGNTIINTWIQYIKQSFNEATVTANTGPTYDTQKYAEKINEAGEYETWNITNLVKSIINGSINDYNGFVIKSSGDLEPFDSFYDSTTSYKPVLQIQYV